MRLIRVLIYLTIFLPFSLRSQNSYVDSLRAVLATAAEDTTRVDLLNSLSNTVFSSSPDEAIQPFKTTRPGGMGVGLYYADKVMETIGGRLLISTAEELDLPLGYDGAAVVLIFNKGK